jgi:hypothetical protein
MLSGLLKQCNTYRKGLLEERPLEVWDAFVRKWENDGGEEDDIEYEAFKAFMSKRYDATDTVSIARQKLDKVYQGNGSVERYIERFVSLLSDVEVEYETEEQEKLHLFMKGLNVQLQLQVRLLSTINRRTWKPFTYLDDLGSFVDKYEDGFKSGHGDAQGGPPKRSAVTTFHTNLGAANIPEEVQGVPPLWGAVGGPLVAPGKGGKVDPQKAVPAYMECYFCKQLGHEAWQCQLKREWLGAKLKGEGFPVPGLIALANLSCTLSPLRNKCNLSCSTISYSTLTSETKATYLSMYLSTLSFPW